jgi:hypothetical protein
VRLSESATPNEIYRAILRAEKRARTMRRFWAGFSGVVFAVLLLVTFRVFGWW